MRILFALVISMALAGVASAGDEFEIKQRQNQGQYQGQKAYGGNARAYGGEAEAKARASSGSYAKGGASGGNVFTVQGDDIDPPAYAPSINLTSHGCIGSTSGSGGGVGLVSLGFGTTEEHRRCTLLEAAKVFIALKQYDKAIILLNSIDWVGEALDAAALAPAPVQASTLLQEINED